MFSELEYYQIFSEQIHRIFQSNNCIIFAFRAVFYAHSSFLPNYALVIVQCYWNIKALNNG